MNLLDENDNVIKTLAFNPNEKKFLTMDPLAEKYYNISPYAYCANNPIRHIDPMVQLFKYMIMQIIKKLLMSGEITKVFGDSMII